MREGETGDEKIETFFNSRMMIAPFQPRPRYSYESSGRRIGNYLLRVFILRADFVYRILINIRHFAYQMASNTYIYKTHYFAPLTYFSIDQAKEYILVYYVGDD